MHAFAFRSTPQFFARIRARYRHATRRPVHPVKRRDARKAEREFMDDVMFEGAYR